MNFKEYLDPDNGYALLKQAGNMPLASHWIEVPEGAECFIRMCTGLKPGTEFFFKDIDGDYMLWRDSNWVQASYDCAKEYIDEGDELLWSREQAQEQGLISGTDAKLAWAKGEDVEFHYADTIWAEIPSCAQLSIFDDEEIKFRLKPRTIKLELEIPACGTNYKHGQLIWVLNSLEPKEYCSVILDESDELPAYWWSTEEEIKQVVAALRGGIKG